MKKVICINNGKINNSDRKVYSNLTIGKWYDIYSVEGNIYHIQCNDSGNSKKYYSSRFLTLSEYRKQKTKTTNNN